MTDQFSKEVPDLLQSHLDHLLKSKISIDVIKGRGYRTIYGSDPHLLELGFTKKQCRRPAGILIPMYGTNGAGIVSYQYRPDNPRIITKEDGKQREIKYESPTGGENHFDIHPSVNENSGNPQIPCWLIEGVKKGDSLVTAGAQFVISLPGVSNWRGKNKFGGKTAIPDFENVAWNDRLVYLCFDSDAWSKIEVATMLYRLASFLKSKKADVRILKLPSGPNGEKIGADDYLSQGHSLQDLIGLETAEAVKPSISKLTDLFEDPYSFEEGCMVYNPNDGKGSPIVLGNFSALISEIITKDNGRETTKYFKIRGFEANKTPLPTMEVSAKNFDNLDFILEGWDVRATISADRSAKARIREMLLKKSYNAMRTTIYSHTGWREIDGKRTFLTAGGAIGIPAVQVDLEDDDLINYYLPQPIEDPRENLIASFNYLKIGNPDVLLPIWASMYMCPLNPFAETCFTLFLQGLSGTKKSGITALALNNYGKNFNYNFFPIGWNATQNKMGSMMSKLKDLPLGVDDFAPSRDAKRNREMEILADVVIRDQANRSGRGRMSSDTSIRKTLRPRGFLFSQGEHMPVTYSNGARMFVVELHKGDIDNEAFFKAVDQRHLYSQAMTSFIVWVDKNWDKLKAEIPKQVKLWTNLAATANKEDQHARLPGAVANLYAGLTVALTFFLENKIISNNEASKLTKEGWNIFTKWSLLHSARVESERPGKRFFEVLMALKNQGSVIFYPIADLDPHHRPGEEPIGWVDKDGYYLNPIIAMTAVRKFCEHSDSPFTIGDDAVWADLKDLGYSECTGTRNKFAKKINSKNEWVIKLKPELFID